MGLGNYSVCGKLQLGKNALLGRALSLLRLLRVLSERFGEPQRGYSVLQNREVAVKDFRFFFESDLTCFGVGAHSLGIPEIIYDRLSVLAIRIPAIVDGLGVDHA